MSKEISEYSENYSDYNTEDEEDTMDTSFVEVEREAYNIYKMLRSEYENNYRINGCTILSNMKLDDIYNWFYTDYEGPF